MAGTRCVAITKKGLPCPTPHWGESQYCVGHDPAITNEQRRDWGRTSPGPTHARDYTLMTPPEIIEYVSKKIHEYETKYGHTAEVMPVITELLRVSLAAHKVMNDKREIGIASKKGENGPRKIRIVRDEPSEPVAPASVNAG